MFCKNCGTKFDNVSGICPSCGTLNHSAGGQSNPTPAMAGVQAGGQGNAQTQSGAAGQSAPTYSQPIASTTPPTPTAAPAPQPTYGTSPAPYRFPLPTKRAWWKMILLGLVTLMIYPIVVEDKMVHELNKLAYDHDGRITLSPMVAGFLAPFTLGIYLLVYEHMYADRLRQELRYRGISYSIGPVHFWLLNFLFGWTLICPLIYLHKCCKAHNLINADYNEKGK